MFLFHECLYSEHLCFTTKHGKCHPLCTGSKQGTFERERGDPLGIPEVGPRRRLLVYLCGERKGKESAVTQGPPLLAPAEVRASPLCWHHGGVCSMAARLQEAEAR